MNNYQNGSVLSRIPIGFKIALFLIAAVVVFAVQPYTFTIIDASHEGILVERFGANRGPQKIDVVNGFVLYNKWTEAAHECPNYIQTRVYTKDANEGSASNEELSITTKDGMNVQFDVSLVYRVETGRFVNIFRRYRRDLPELERGIFRTYVRSAYQQAADSFSAVELYEQRNKFESIAFNILKSKV